MRKLLVLLAFALVTPAGADEPTIIFKERIKGCDLEGDKKLKIHEDDVSKPCAFFVGRPIMEIGTNIGIETACRVKVKRKDLDPPEGCTKANRMQTGDRFRIDSFDVGEFYVTYRPLLGEPFTRKLERITTENGKTWGYVADDPIDARYKWFFYLEYKRLDDNDDEYFEKHYVVDIVDSSQTTCWPKHELTAANITMEGEDGYDQKRCDLAPDPAPKASMKPVLPQGETGGGSEPPPK